MRKISIIHIRSEYLKNIVKLTSGTIFAQGLLVLSTPILTRLYSPEDFGTFALYFSILGIISTVVTGKYELAILLPKKTRDSYNLMGLAVIISFVFTLLFLVIVILFKHKIAMLLGNSSIERWLILLPFVIFNQGLIFIFGYWNNRNKEFSVIALSKGGRGTLLTTSTLVFGILRLNKAGLIFGHFIGQVTELFVLIRKSNFKEIIKNITFSEIKAIGARYARFPKFTAPSNLLNVSTMQLPIILLTKFFDEIVVGFYSQALQIINIPISVLGTSIGQVFYQKCSELRDNPKQIAQLTERTFLRLFYLGVVPISLIIIYGDVIFAFVLGSKWGMAGVYSKLIATWLLFVFVSLPLTNLILVFEKQKIGLLFDIITISTRIIAILVGYYFTKNAYITILMFGAVGALVRLIYSSYLLKIAGVRVFFVVSKALVIYLIVLSVFFASRILLSKMGFCSAL